MRRFSALTALLFGMHLIGGLAYSHHIPVSSFSSQCGENEQGGMAMVLEGYLNSRSSVAVKVNSLQAALFGLKAGELLEFGFSSRPKIVGLDGLEIKAEEIEGMIGRSVMATTDCVIRLKRRHQAVDDIVPLPNAGTDEYKNIVRAIQNNLNKLGYAAGTADGVYGNKTRAAIHQFSKSRGFSLSGEIDPHAFISISAALHEADVVYAAFINDDDAAFRFLDEGDNIDSVDRYGNTALYYFVENNNISAVEKLMKKGANPNIYKAISPLHMAAHRGDETMIEMLIGSGANINSQDQVGNSPIHNAANLGSPQTLSALLRLGASANSSSPQHSATPLMLLAQGGPIDEAQSLEMLRILLDAGAELNATDRRGFTAVHMAAFMGHDAMLDALIGAGADVNLHAKDGSTALHFAAMGNQKRTAKYLLGIGFPKELKNASGETAFELAKKHKHNNVLPYLK